MSTNNFKSTENNGDVSESELIFDGKNKNVVALDELLRTIKGVKFGAVQVIIQDGLIVQIDKTEKFRLKAERSERNLGQFTATHRGTSLTY